MASNGKPLGELQFSNGPSYGADIINSVTNAWLLASIFAIGIAALAGWFMSKRVTRPVLALESATQQMEQGDLRARGSCRMNASRNFYPWQVRSMAWQRKWSKPFPHYVRLWRMPRMNCIHRSQHCRPTSNWRVTRKTPSARTRYLRTRPRAKSAAGSVGAEPVSIFRASKRQSPNPLLHGGFQPACA